MTFNGLSEALKFICLFDGLFTNNQEFNFIMVVDVCRIPPSPPVFLPWLLLSGSFDYGLFLENHMQKTGFLKKIVTVFDSVLL